MATEYNVEVVRYGTLEVVKSIGPMPWEKAEKVESGIDINLNYEEFFTVITPVGEDDE